MLAKDFATKFPVIEEQMRVSIKELSSFVSDRQNGLLESKWRLSTDNFGSITTLRPDPYLCLDVSRSMRQLVTMFNVIVLM